MSIAHVYVDEYGDPNLRTEKQGTTPFFVYAALVILDENLSHAREIHDEIVKEFFSQRGHIKSSKISTDDKGYNIQINIIKKLQTLKHYITCVVVDKWEIAKGGGLFYKQPFIKFFQKILSQEITGKYDEIHINMDNLGRPKFKQSLKDYMRRLGYENNLLFSINTFEYKNDISEEPLIQIADFYAGCIGRYLCNTYNKNQSENMYNLIKTYTFIRWFPFVKINYLGAKFAGNNSFKREIFDIAIRSAERYLDVSTDDTGKEIVADFLQAAHDNPMKYISSGEIRKRMLNKGIKIKEPIIEMGKLRSAGVFLVSPQGKKGYKFPCNEDEIADHFRRVKSNVITQFERANILHRILIEQSTTNYNILKKDEFSVLNDLIDVAINRRLINH